MMIKNILSKLTSEEIPLYQVGMVILDLGATLGCLIFSHNFPKPGV